MSRYAPPTSINLQPKRLKSTFLTPGSHIFNLRLSYKLTLIYDIVKTITTKSSRFLPSRIPSLLILICKMVDTRGQVLYSTKRVTVHIDD